jgi:hypothetical protein
MTLKLSNALCERARRAAEAAGYSSLEEFIEHAIEKELAGHESPNDDKEQLEKQLRGLGYIK